MHNMNLFVYYLGFIIFINSYFSGILVQNDHLNHFNTRLIASLSPKETVVDRNTIDFTKDDLWRPVPLFKNTNPTLYSFAGNRKFLISVQKEKAVPVKRRSDLDNFFKQEEEKKAIILSKTSIRDKKVSVSKKVRIKETDLFYRKGTYIDFQKERVSFEDWSFYHNKVSLYILVHYTHSLTAKEVQSVRSFIAGVVKREASLTAGEVLTEKIREL